MTSIKTLWRISYVLALLLVVGRFITIFILELDSGEPSNFFTRTIYGIMTIFNEIVPKLLFASFSGWVIAHIIRSWKQED